MRYNTQYLVLVLVSFELNAINSWEGKGNDHIQLFLQQSFSKPHSRCEMMECSRRVSFVVNI